MYSILGLLLFILFVCSSATPFSSIGSRRSILREVSDNNKSDHPDYAVELNSTNFDDVLKDTPDTYAVVEFFAHWCPACRNYKPHYEKVARLFNGPDAVHPGIILMTRVDCASRINTKLCDKFSVGHYPMLFWGHPSKFVGGSWEPKQEKSDLRVIDDARTADLLLNWINLKLGSSFGLDDSKFETEYLSSNISDPGQAIYDVEEATSTAFDIILEHKMIKPETRASLIKFLQLLVAHHPSRRCRKGSAELLVSFDDLYPTDFWSNNEQEADKGSVSNLKICGKDVPRGYWTFCRGSKNDTRGFSCGLWVLLHSLSVRIEDGESQFAFNATCDFVRNFFICEECRQHFYKMCSSVSSTFNKAHDYALWLWSTHNKVNERLSKEESSLGTGDPNFPKTIWPPKQLCPSCYLGHDHRNNKIEWNQDEVYKFLVTYYGKTITSLYNKDKIVGNNGTDRAIEDLVVEASNAIVVPLGAALAIAVASCAFGALACYWRSHQKSRKYFHHLHSLNNI
ncbi:PREDICTED: sulfhydryl oxidase 2-like isoform X2 [Lupinus angustifolius]|uniref:sulfhydryl oxidase 2-like isoform X2 n=1 Tax=Lupinus angustifolius TaxID=3871 RepID=UPI00092EAE87|nr:PREDICTED: sulfhydryl oxidase 2-like isoform X2 [Lupinus angustifolius]